MPEPDDPTVRLERWGGPISSDDPDANFKREVAAYSQQDPLLTLGNMARNLDVPVGALARYVLSRWAAAGSEALLEIGPSVVDRMSAAVAQAEREGTDAGRLEAYDQLRQMISWLRTPLDDPSVNPAGGAD